MDTPYIVHTADIANMVKTGVHCLGLKARASPERVAHRNSLVKTSQSQAIPVESWDQDRQSPWRSPWKEK